MILSIFIINSSYAFTFNNNVALAFSQDEVKVNIAKSNCTNIGIDDNELYSIVADAVDLYWNKVPTSRLKLRAGSLQTTIAAFKTGLICLVGTSCEPNPVLAVSSDILISCNQNSSNFTSSSVLAVTVPNNISGKSIIGSLILINDQGSNQFQNKSREEKVSIIAHEIGHAFGLGHSPVKDSLMYYSTVSLRTSLGSDDMDGISYLYPKSQGITCASTTESSHDQTNMIMGLILGLLAFSLLNQIQLWYLKLRPRF